MAFVPFDVYSLLDYAVYTRSGWSAYTRYDGQVVQAEPGQPDTLFYGGQSRGLIFRNGGGLTYGINPGQLGTVAPSTFPTGWYIAPYAGFTCTIMSTSLFDGAPGVRYRIQGTTTIADQNMLFIMNGRNACSAGQLWIQELSFRTHSAGPRNPQLQIGSNYWAAGSTYLGGQNAGFFGPGGTPIPAVGSSMDECRIAWRSEALPATIVEFEPFFVVNGSNNIGVYDYQFEVILPSSAVRNVRSYTPAGLITNQADTRHGSGVASLIMNRLPDWFNMAEGTIFIEFCLDALPLTNVPSPGRGLFTLHYSNTEKCSILFSGGATNTPNVLLDNYVAGTNSQFTVGTVTGPYQQQRLAMTYNRRTNQYRISSNNGAVSNYNFARLPYWAGLNIGCFNIDPLATTGDRLQGAIARFDYVPFAIDDAALQAYT